MALSFTAYDYNTGTVSSATSLPSASIPYSAGQPITVSVSANGSGATISVADTKGLTWNQLVTNSSNGEPVTVWYAIPVSSGSTVVTASATVASWMSMRVTTYQNAGTPRSLGASGTLAASTPFSLVVTPTSSGSALWLIANDFNAVTGAVTTGSGMSSYNEYNSGGGHVDTIILGPTTNPLTSAANFTLAGTTAAGTAVDYVAFEVPFVAPPGIPVYYFTA